MARLAGPRSLCALTLLATGAAASGDAEGNKGWVLGKLGATCEEACLEVGHLCSETHWPTHIDHLKAIVSELNYPCKRYQEGSIRYDPSASGPYCGWNGDLRNRPHHRCTAKPPISAQRFCYCGKEAPPQDEVIDVEAEESPSSEPFNCEVGFHNRVVGWSVYKMVWCCREKNIGCEAGTSAPYDCDAGYDNWRLGWSYNKCKWCCDHRGRACPRTTLEPEGGRVAQPTTTAEPYDCDAGFSNWERGWSDGKKEWCCSRHERGCAPEPTTTPPFDCDDGYDRWEEGWSVQKQYWCCQHKQRACSTTSNPFDCAAGYDNWLLGWSSEKKDWCCEHKDRGCLNRARQQQTTIVTTTTATTMTVTTTTATTTTTPLFDCDAGYANWMVGWSDEKKDWCCRNEQKGCSATTTACEFDCMAGLSNFEAGWSSEKKEWCCAHQNLGCPETTTPPIFDCLAGVNNWLAGWSAEKKDWCCRTKGVGCHTTTIAPVFDCKAGLQNWVAGWSLEKQKWCCEHENLGCLEYKAEEDLNGNLK